MTIYKHIITKFLIYCNKLCPFNLLFKKISIFTSKNKIKSFIWQLRECLNSNPKNNARIVFSDPKNIKKKFGSKRFDKNNFFQNGRRRHLGFTAQSKNPGTFSKNLSTRLFIKGSKK